MGEDMDEQEGVEASRGEGGLQIWYRDRQVKWREIPRPAPRPEPRPRAPGRVMEVRKKLHRPAADHPWKKWRPPWQQGQEMGWATRAAR
ncbi:MAG: hypothetical protein O7A06_00470 [Acidobacteria bacterium]|nr:hypothetical protein [Acidobacteriota bacterium]